MFNRCFSENLLSFCNVVQYCLKQRGTVRMDNIQVSCGYCHRKVANLRRCSRCLSVFYCSKVCQTMDWPSHKFTCARQTEIRKKTAEARIRSDYKTPFENHTTSEKSAKNQANDSKTRIVDPESTQSKDSYDVYRHDPNFDDHIEAKMKNEYSISKMMRQEKDDQRRHAAGSVAINESSCDIRVADMDNMQVKCELKNDQFINMSNAKPDSGEENMDSVTNDCGEETDGSITKAHGKGKGVSNKTDSGEGKSGLVAYDCGEEKGGSGTNSCGEEKDGSETNACGEERHNSDTNASREEKGVSVTKDCREVKDGSVTNECRKKDNLGANASWEENGGSCTSVSREEKSGSVANDCGEEKDGTNICGSCGSQGSFQKCSRCKAVFYCSKECQRKDWPTHKYSCTKKLTEEDKIKAVYEKMKKQNESYQRFKETKDFTIDITNFEGSMGRMMQMLTLEQALHRATRPAGSLQRARRLARIFFPIHDIVTDFDDIPWEQVFPFFPFMFRPPRSGYVLVAFMYRYHEHVMRHGVYLKDAEDKESKVEFYLDDFGDNPFPFFSYSQVKPGGYICLVDPVMHLFMDGSVGIRINNPAEVMVMNIEMVMK